MKMNAVVLWMLCLSVVFTGVYSVGADRVSVSVMEGDSVTLPTGVKADQHETIKWYFNDARIAQITGDLSKICTDVQCNNEGTERFRDRLQLDHQTGSLTITDTRTTDSGEYILEIIDTGSEPENTFYVTVHGVSADRDKMKGTSEKERESGLSSADVAGICVGVGVVLLIVAAAGVIYYRKHPQAGQRSGTRTQRSDQENGVTYTSVNLDDNESEPAATELTHNGNVNTSETPG
uniref:Immunoglobulin domain-containing protein n=1 Tax=Cyprinus carpio TaxID=7962 RepID=A0A8C1TIB0_CYPCA